MKKRIIYLVLIILLFTTGCTTEYNLTIDNNVYIEKITISGSTQKEISNFDKQWLIPVDKDEFQKVNSGEDPDIEIMPEGKIYDYQTSSNKLIFSNDFSSNDISNSTAIYICYDQASITNYEDSIIISTSSKVKCFDTYPYLDSIKVTIETDKPVKKHNADKVTGNTYIWNISKTDKSNKPINMIIDNSYSESTTPSDSSQPTDSSNSKKDYTLYIFCGILLVILLSVYFIFNKLKNNNDNQDV